MTKQAIIWTSEEPVHLWLYVSPGFNELSTAHTQYVIPLKCCLKGDGQNQIPKWVLIKIYSEIVIWAIIYSEIVIWAISQCWLVQQEGTFHRVYVLSEY